MTRRRVPRSRPRARSASPVRGAVPGSVHRDHRGDLHEDRRRAVRHLQRAVDAEHVLTRAVMEGSGTEGIGAVFADVTKGGPCCSTCTGCRSPAPGAPRACAPSGSGRSCGPGGPTGPRSVSPSSIAATTSGSSPWALAAGSRHSWPSASRSSRASSIESWPGTRSASSRSSWRSRARWLTRNAVCRVISSMSLARGSLSTGEAVRGLARFGFDKHAQVIVLSLEAVDGDPEPGTLADAVTDDRSRVGDGFLASSHDAGVHLLLPADPARPRGHHGLDRWNGSAEGCGSAPVPRSIHRRRALPAGGSVCAAGVQARGWPHAGLPTSGRTACCCRWPIPMRSERSPIRCSTHWTPTTATTVASCSSRSSPSYSTTRWETAAAQLFVHRHTLRYRMRKVEELTGRDLSSSFDRMEFWLALRARDLQAAQIDG